MSLQWKGVNFAYLNQRNMIMYVMHLNLYEYIFIAFKNVQNQTCAVLLKIHIRHLFKIATMF